MSKFFLKTMIKAASVISVTTVVLTCQNIVAAENNTNNNIITDGGYINSIDPDFNGIAESTDGNWYLLKNGEIDFTFTGLKTHRTGTWYFQNGKMAKTYSGKVNYNGFTYNIVSGKSLDFPESFYGVKSGRKTYIIGDSRTAQAYSSAYNPEDWKNWSEKNYTVKGLEIWKALGGSNYKYMAQALQDISIRVDNVSDVILLSGYNDCRLEPIGTFDSEYLYVKMINSKAKEFKAKGARIYYVSVNPGAETATVIGTSDSRNKKIREFNNFMKNNLSDDVFYIDTYGLFDLEKNTYDGVHYNKQTNMILMKYILNQMTLIGGTYLNNTQNEIDPSFTGVKYANGILKRFENNNIDHKYSGLDQYTYDGKWYYFKNGIFDHSYTGLSKSTNGNFYYVRNGLWDTSYTGFTKYTDSKWYFVKNGRYDTSYTGLAYNENNGGWFYSDNGKYNNKYSGIAKSTNGRLYYVKNGWWNTSYTGLAQYTDGKWYYVRSGRFEPYTGICKSTNGKLYYAKNGLWNTGYTGLAQYHADGKWYYVRNGRFMSYTGVTKSTNDKLYYAKNGLWDTSFTGIAKDSSGKIYSVKNGRV